MRAVLKNIKKHSPHIWSFYFEPERPWRFTAGEYTQLYLPHQSTDSRGDKRWFTISSSPTEDWFTITCKFVDRSSSFKKILRNLQVGAEVSFAEPMGDFVLPKDQAIPLIFVAGGIGITPMHSMTAYVHALGQHRDISLLYSAQNQEELVLLDTFRQYNMPIQVFLSQSSQRLTTGHIIKAAAKPESLIYIAGPESFVESINYELKQVHNLPSHRILTDFFHGYPEI